MAEPPHRTVAASLTYLASLNVDSWNGIEEIQQQGKEEKSVEPVINNTDDLIKAGKKQ